jgi:DNA-binding NtrC family response regulator
MTAETPKANILVVDDDNQLRELLTETLSVLGYRAVAASGGVEALQRLAEERFDLMITDIKMPDIDGLQLVKKVQRHHTDLPVLFITGVASREMVTMVSHDGFLAKPFRISKIEAMIESALSGAERDNRVRRCRVLVMEKDENLREALADALNQSYYLPFTVATCDEAVQELENGEFDAIIADIETADVCGETWFSTCRERHPDIPVIATGNTITPEQMSPQMLPIQAYLQKPFKISEVLRELNQYAPIGNGNPAG